MRALPLSACALVLSIAAAGAQTPQQAPPSPAAPPGAQQPAPGAPPAAPGQPQAVFRSSTRLVIQNVYVKDREGRPIPGLTEKDFTVTEENQRQDIAFVEYQRIAGDPGSAPVEPLVADAAPAAAPGVGRIANVEIATPPPGNIKYQDRRLLVMFFDQSSMPQADQLRAYENARKYIGTQMAATDSMAVMTFQNGVLRIRQDFTSNRAALREVIDVLQLGDDLNGDGVSDLDGGSAFGQGDAEFSVFNTNRSLSALQTAVNQLRALPEQKTLIYFVSGLRLNGSENDAQLRATTNAAIRANVTLNPIDARGLSASAPLGDATRASSGNPGSIGGGGGGSNSLAQSQDTLFALAKDTGGKAMIDYNDLSVGIVQAAQAATDYYIVGYYSAHTATDGKFRRVRVTVPGSLNAEVKHREGYYADKTFASFNTADRERQLEEAFALEDPITEIAIAMELNYFQLDRANYYVPVALKIPGSELNLARSRGAARTSIDFIGEIKDEFGITILNIRDKIDIRLSDEDAEQLARRPIQYENGYVLLPAKYVIKVLARDATTGRIGTFQTTFVVPNLMREAERLPVSSVVLSSQRIAAGDELFAVKQDLATAGLNPLVLDGQRLVPSVTRVFSSNRDLHIYLEAYQRGETTMRPLVAVVTFYRGEEKAFETAPLPVIDGMHPKSKSVPVKFSVPLKNIAPGRYDVQVSVLDPNAQKAAFWRAPLVVVP